jgi:hypothetical protein
MTRWSASLVVLLGACATSSLPGDVERFVARRDTCDHLRGEERDPADRDGTRDLAVEIDRYCRGTDAELARLRGRFYRDGPVIERLSRYETRIEK